MDFYGIEVVEKERPVRWEIIPEFYNEDSDDMMIRGHDFYAVWDEESKMWSKNIMVIRRRIDNDIKVKYNQMKDTRADGSKQKIVPKYMRSDSSGSWHRFRRYIDGLPDHFHQLDEKITFQDTVTEKHDYRSKRLSYSMREGDISAYEELVSVLYAPEERAKFEWAIGSILAGDTKKIQKFIVFHGPMGSGKSTIMNLIEKLFGGYKDGYCAKIDAQALVGGNVGFALTPFAKGPLVGIDQDSKLSRIEDNTILNQIVSHDTLQINQKFKDLFESSTACFLFMGTNEPVRITNSKSGIIRRLIDVEPTGNLVTPESKYDKLVEQMNYELGAIAWHCLQVYKKMGKSYYSRYIPKRMMLRTDPFFNFMVDNLEFFKKNGGVTANELWAMYKTWCDDSGMDYRLKRFQVIDEAKSYFEKFEERAYVDNKQVRNWYSGIKTKKFVSELKDLKELEKAAEKKPDELKVDIPDWLEMKQQHSILDDVLADYPAQYGDAKPKLYWHDTIKIIDGKSVFFEGVKTKLKDLDTSKTHFVQMPLQMIQFDFDKKDKNGKKNFLLNVQAILRLGLPPTYAERSKGGEGIHLAYWYDGDPGALSYLMEEDVEVKVQIGDFALRRRLSLCNDHSIAHISSGLPLKEKKRMVNQDALNDAQHLRNLVLKALKKEIEPKATVTSVEFIDYILAQAQEKGINYDLSDLDGAIYSFAAASTHQSERCLKLYAGMKLRWPETIEEIPDPAKQIINTHHIQTAPIVFFDVEVFKNVNIIVYKEIGADKKCVWLINPKPVDIEQLFNMRLVGFNNRGYDNFILWAIYIGYTPRQVYDLSQSIIVGGNRSPFRDAENISYTDVYDYASEKKSLKKWEIALGEPHVELDWPWDEELPEEMWETAAKYCENDVRATEAVWNATQADFKAREILAEIAGMTVNNTTNQLTTRIIFGDAREPWKEFNYPDLKSKFPEYRFEFGKSYYGDVLIGEGGRVYAQPGMYSNVKTFDVASMHPSSIIAENGFGPYTTRFQELMDIRIAIKHQDLDAAKKMLNGVLAPYLNNPDQADQLSFALKIAINSVYGLTAAKFQTKFKDPRNVDNWVAKRGALFMESLRRKVQGMNAIVVHIKTDSIKVADPTPEIEDFILSYGKEWGYNFEVESIYERICLVNDAVYIAKSALNCPSWLKKCKKAKKKAEESGKPYIEPTRWTATGAQFQHPYVFKVLFSKEPLTFDDRCEVRTVTSAMYLDMNEQKAGAESYEKELDKCEKAIKKLYAEMKEKLNLTESLEEWLKEDEWHSHNLAYSDNHAATDYFDPLNELFAREKQLFGIIADCHDYKFIGKAGLFCPIQPGFGGGELVRKGSNGSYASVTGTKGYRWLEAEEVKRLHYESHIDEGYFRGLVDDAVKAISAFGNFELFVSNDAFLNREAEQKETPPWETPCRSKEYANCSDCPHYYYDQEYCCKLGYNVSNQLITE